jgi:hypothetical protein
MALRDVMKPFPMEMGSTEINDRDHHAGLIC